MSSLLRECFELGSGDANRNAGRKLSHKMRMAEANILSGQALK